MAQCLTQAHNNPARQLGRGHSLDVGLLEGGPRARARSPIRVSYHLSCHLLVVCCKLYVISSKNLLLDIKTTMHLT